jgi:uncharacterized protein YrrD
MLRNAKDLKNFSIQANDGEIGHVKDLYFDDDAWAMRYLVVETGTWLSSRKVLISPMAVQDPDWLSKSLGVSLTMKQIEKSPDVDTDKPVSRQNEEQYFGYYGYPYYWGGQGLWGEGMYPYSSLPDNVTGRTDWLERQREDELALRAERARHRHDDPHLRSCNAVVGYHVEARDGEIGHVAGFLMDELTWAIRFIVVDTSNWWMGHKVLIAPGWITGVHWTSETVSVNVNREDIQAAPAYDPAAVMDLAWELQFHEHYRDSESTRSVRATQSEY